MILSELEVQAIIPQKHPMVMVGALLQIDDSKVVTEFKIPKDHILLKNGSLCESALIENMAQTAAVKSGYFAQKQNQKMKMGFIGAIKNFDFLKKVGAEDILKTMIVTTNEIFNASVIEGEIYCREQLVAKGELKIFLIDEPESK